MFKFKQILPYKVIIGLCLIIMIVGGFHLVNTIKTPVAKAAGEPTLSDVVNMFLSNLQDIGQTPAIQDEMLGEKVQFDKQVFTQEVWLNNDSGVIYLGYDKDVGIRISSGVLQGKLTTAGSWSAFGASTPGDEGWLAYEPIMVSATNEQGYRYAVIVGGSETATSSITNADSTTVLIADGGFITTGTADFNAAVSLDTTLAVTGNSTLTGDTTVGGTFGVTGATTLSNTLALTGAATLSSTLAVSGLATFSNSLVVLSSVDTVAAGVLNIGTSTATSIEIADTSITTNIQGPLTTAETIVGTGAVTFNSTLTGTGNWDTSGNMEAANATFTGSLTVDTDTLYVDNSANAVGIGTTTPNITGASLSISDELEVFDATSPYDVLIELKDSATDTDSGIINIYENTTITALISGATGEDTYFDTNMFFLDGSANKIYMATSTIGSGQDSVLTVMEGISIFDASSDYDQLFHFIDSGDDALLMMYENNSQTIQLAAAASTASYIGGYVGIGTSTPASTYALDVYGNFRVGEEGSASAFIIDGGTQVASFGGALTITGAAILSSTLAVTGNVEFDGGTFIFNESSADKDFRIESNGNDYMFFVDGGNDQIGIGTSTITATMDIYSTATTSLSVDTTGVVGGCLMMKDNVGTQYYGTLTTGTLNWTTAATDCGL